ncbi:MAG: DUF1828 domain-containing protein [Thalassospira sp.]|jgi:hypothetical protein|nr:DUF1828 domain-containing protein [Thalassospira sp.]
MIKLDDLRKRLSGNTLIAAVDDIKDGHIRIQTTFQYPDTSYIDIYLKQAQPNLLSSLDSTVTLTDFASSLMILMNFQINPLRSPTNRKRLEHIKESYDVVFQDGALECNVNVEEIISGIIRLGQACLLFTALMFTKRLSWSTDFSQQVEDLIADCDIDYEQNGQIMARDGNVLTVDFLTKGKRAPSGIMQLSSNSEHYAHQRSTDIFARWDDILTLTDWHGQRITLVDDSKSYNYRDEDLKRLERKSTLLFISEAATITDLLRAS